MMSLPASPQTVESTPAATAETAVITQNIQSQNITTNKKLDNNVTACPCSNISIMQLFHELKAKFPAVPDQIVQECINKYYHDRDTCISLLNAEQSRLPRGLPYPPGLMGILQLNSGGLTELKQTCTTCGMLNTKNASLLSSSQHCTKQHEQLLVDTKDKLNCIVPNDVAPSNNCALPRNQLMSKNTKFYLSNLSDDNNMCNEEVDNSSCLITNNNQLMKNENVVGTSKKFVKKSLNKVGKFAEKLTKKCDLIKTSNNDNDCAMPKQVLNDSLFGCASNRKELDSGFVDDSIAINNCDNKNKSLSMECLLSERTKSFGNKANSLQDLNTTHIYETIDSDTDSDSETALTPQFTLTKSSRLTDFNSKKPPIIPIKKIERKSILPNSSPVETESKSIVDQKPPLPKRPTTLTVSNPYKPNDTNLSPTSVNLSLNVNVDVITPPKSQRTVLNVSPELSWLNQSTTNIDNQSPRSFTSVNLTLRTPTSEPQSPIDIQSSNNGLTYSSSSFDPRKGFQSSVQITVGPAGGTVSAVRVRPRSSYIPDNNSPVLLSPRAGSLPDLPGTSISNLIKRQVERKEKLRLELITEKRKLVLMQKEVRTLETQPKEISISTNIAEEKRIRYEILQLQKECERLAGEVDRRSHSRAPLGETNEEFYQNIYTGQRVTIEPVVTARIEQTENGPPWTCYMCTFSNHPLMNICEQCGMIRRIRRGRTDIGEDNNNQFVNESKQDLIAPANLDFFNTNQRNDNDNGCTTSFA